MQLVVMTRVLHLHTFTMAIQPIVMIDIRRART